MKRITGLLFVTMVFLSMGCENVVQERQENSLVQFREGPVVIAWSGDSGDTIQSYQANVHVYSKNSRKDTAAMLNQTYRLAVKTVNERVLTRIDFDFDESIPFRTVISDGEEALVVNPLTEEIAQRIPIGETDSPLYRLFENQTGLSRINLSLVREEAKRLSLDLQEDAETGCLLLELPPELIPQNGLDRITRSRAVFDATNDVLVETEVIMVREDSTTVTTLVTPVYEFKDSIPVKVGTITVIDSKAAELIDGIDPDMPVYNSPDDIPTLSESDFNRMMESGELNEISGITFGDPADLSYVETIYEVYQDIEINTVPDQLFRLIQK
jgi:hypothetical protein